MKKFGSMVLVGVMLLGMLITAVPVLGTEAETVFEDSPVIVAQNESEKEAIVQDESKDNLGSVVEESGITSASNLGIIPFVAIDYSSKVAVLDWDILDVNGVPVSETNIAVSGTRYQFKLSWELIPSGTCLT